MKKISIALALVIAAPAAAVAEHGGPWMSAFPPDGGTLPPNGRIVLASVNGQDRALPGQGAQGLTLVSEGHPSVELRVVETHDDPDGYGEAAAVLVPATSLIPGATYELALPDDYRFRWTIGERADTLPPTWKAAPRVEISKDLDLGLSPGYPLVRIRAADDNRYLALRVTLSARARSGKKISRTAIWAFADDGSDNGCVSTAYLAAGMEVPVRVRIALLDVAGHTRPTRTKLVLATNVAAYLCLVP